MWGQLTRVAFQRGRPASPPLRRNGLILGDFPVAPPVPPPRLYPVRHGKSLSEDPQQVTRLHRQQERSLGYSHRECAPLFIFASPGNHQWVTDDPQSAHPADVHSAKISPPGLTREMDVRPDHGEGT